MQKHEILTTNKLVLAQKNTTEMCLFICLCPSITFVWQWLSDAINSYVVLTERAVTSGIYCAAYDFMGDYECTSTIDTFKWPIISNECAAFFSFFAFRLYIASSTSNFGHKREYSTDDDEKSRFLWLKSSFWWYSLTQSIICVVYLKKILRFPISIR